jgi:TPR repeat protein
MSIPPHQVVEVRARRPGQDDEVGSGFLLSDRLVLTTAHLVFTESGAPSDVVPVRLGREQTEDFVRARVVWPARRAPTDIALVEITDQTWCSAEPVQTPRWGRITGGAAEIPCDAIGFPRVRRDPDAGRDSGHLSGSINPGDQLRGRRYGLSVHSGEPDSPSLWKGVSGAALFSGALLIGVVIAVPGGFGGRVLTAEPILPLASDPELRAVLENHGISVELESVELESLFDLPARPLGNQSRAQLLNAGAEVVPFRGREEVLADLASWCGTGDDFSARLIIGPGGQGKTRLAGELCRRMRRDGRIAGLVHDPAPEQVIRRLAETSEPVLLVVDLAEGRSEVISSIVDVAQRRSPNAPAIRLLLLARSAGDWWDELRQKTRGQLSSAPCTALPLLDDDKPGQLLAYSQALNAFAGWLTEAEPEGHWPEIASRLAETPADNTTSVTVLTLHMKALTALLREAGPGEMDGSLGERPEDVLLDYEMAFWSASAPPGRMGSSALRRGVAAAMLCGAADAQEARNLLYGLKDSQRASLDDWLAIAGWIHSLYPVPSGRYWGYLQPDRVGEHLIRRVANAEPDFLTTVANAASASQLSHAMTVFARIGGRMNELGMLGEARTWYRRAADRGHMDAAFKLGTLLREDDPAEASSWYERAALSGHNDAAFQLGRLQEGSKTAKARKWYERAALSGHNDAAYHLGELLWKEGHPVKARKWFMRAAAAEHAYAAYQLGWLLRKAEGDHAGATFWWRMASDYGYSNAAFDLAQLHAKDGRPDEARHWYKQAATAGHNDAAFALAELLWTDGNPLEAIPLYKQAAEHDHAHAAYQLGWLLNEQNDHAGAIHWWQTAADRGSEKARRHLAELNEDHSAAPANEGTAS